MSKKKKQPEKNIPSETQCSDSKSGVIYELVKGISNCLQAAIQYGAILWMIYFISKAAPAFAGKSTVLNADIKYNNPEVTNAVITIPSNIFYSSLIILAILVVALICWGKLERSQRKRYIIEHSHTLSEYEKRIDLGRLSSGLTREGENQKWD